MILVFEASPNSGAATFLNAKADQVGFVVVSCSFSGNFTGTPGTVWNNDNPRITGWEDFDYTTEVINRVRVSDNCSDAFVTGISKGGHMSFAYACERPAMIKAAGPMDEFMGLTSNLPSAPVPMIVFQGTADSNVPYTMVKDSVDAWLTMNGLLNVVPITTYEASPLIPGKVTQTTWRGGTSGAQVAFVTLVGGTHTYPTPGTQTGYNIADGLWAFFSQYLSSLQAAPKIVSSPVNNIQPAGQPASFWVSATGNPPLAYQWLRNGTNIPGATAKWFTTPPATTADSDANFRAVVGNGSGSVTSAPAILTVNAAPTEPVIIVQPSNQVVMAGQPVSLSVAASGSGTLRYQWLQNGFNLVGANAATLAIPAAIAADNGATFRAVVTNGSGSVTSVAATLTVNPAPGAPMILTHPIRARVLVGQTASFSVSAWSQAPMSYQWQKGVFAGTMTNIPGATNATYVIPSPALADHTTLFRCVVSSAAGNATSASEMLFVTSAVKAPTDITSPITVSAQAGVPFSYAITSSGGTTPIIYSAAPLPAGLTVNTNTGEISGTSALLGTTVIVITASNSAGATTANLKLTVLNTAPAVPLEDWRRAHFGASAYNQAYAGDSADPDADGIANLLEYAYGTDPLKVDKTAVRASIEHEFLTLTTSRNSGGTNLTWKTESSANLTDLRATNTTILPSTNTLFKVRDNFSVTTNTERFLRLNVSPP